jgi:hypothetical protein
MGRSAAIAGLAGKEFASKAANAAPIRMIFFIVPSDSATRRDLPYLSGSSVPDPEIKPRSNDVLAGVDMDPTSNDVPARVD